ncbi:hypothetical protein MYX84_09305 [Acidobacteria bacterium AH-259-O06]|nr:hypothetical protein [Acidobacteria bacterium AH-259-O06]
MIVYSCDLCGEIKQCLHKEIDGKEYDICPECWNGLEEKLRGKGRVRKHGEPVYIPPGRADREEKEKPVPGEPPEIWYRSKKPISRPRYGMR